MVGLAFIALGVVLILLAGTAGSAHVVKWLENDLDAPQWRAVRRIWPLKSMFDLHYEVSKKLLKPILVAFLFIVGLAMIIAGVQEVR